MSSSNNGGPVPRSQAVVLITGCGAGGLGESLALAFHAKGLRVIATSRRLETMFALEAAEIETIELDVSKADEIAKVRDQVQELTGGRLDVLVNNAGMSYTCPLVDLDLTRVKALFDVNFFAALAMVQAFLPLLLATPGARILNVGSVAGVCPVPFGGAYNASKAALHAMGNTLRVELAPFNIKVTTAVLGNMSTHIIRPGNRLVENSLYLPINDIFKSRRLDHFHDGADTPQDMARRLVDGILVDHPRAWWWGGKSSWMIWFISTFLGQRGFDGTVSRMFGLDKLAAIMAQERKTA